jgi:adenine-specific DNA-methyltransferase
VVEFILDLVGYTADQPLDQLLLVEPAAGEGSFLLSVVKRLVMCCRRRGVAIASCQSAVVAYELDEDSAQRARTSLQEQLQDLGVAAHEAETLTSSWIRVGDYLMGADFLVGKADFVVGNPPYIRLEDMESGGEIYRAAYSTMIGRADIYVAFFEAALRHLKPGGACGFICADRWMFNQYGAALRSFITRNYSVEAVVQMHHADAFEKEVSAYPAVTLIRKADQGSVVVAVLDSKAEQVGSSALAQEISDARIGKGGTHAALIESWFTGASPWSLMQPARLALLRRLEAEFLPIEKSGATVGIGVATGADRVFITKDASLVEPDRLLPLAMAKDANGTAVRWSGHYLVNPWNGSGLVNLNDYPMLANYLSTHKVQLKARHVGQKTPANWYRTIDRVDGPLKGKQKLYLPDFKGRIAPVLDRGETYPHHNLYFIAPDRWEPEVLGGLLLSDVAQFFMEAYGVRMRGGYLRFQAQYLRRICVPDPTEIPAAKADLLRTAFATHDVSVANMVAGELYRLTQTERELIGSSATVS